VPVRLCPYWRDSIANKLAANASAIAHSPPTITAMMTSNGHRLCEVGSIAVSTATRTRIAAGTAAPTSGATRLYSRGPF
jgi:hypothetical protein